MEMKGEYVIPAPRAAVWAGLNDVNVLKAVIPGCDSINRLSDTEIEATVTAKVGPVKASFKGLVTLSNIDAPNGYTIRGEGKGGVAGFAKGGANVHLFDDPAGTRLTYEVDASVGGKLAQIGARLIDSTAKKMADDFFARFGQAITNRTEAANVPAPETPTGPRPGDMALAAVAVDVPNTPVLPEAQPITASFWAIMILVLICFAGFLSVFIQ
jgi:carbon monoxide dehydrogenase subunit G